MLHEKTSVVVVDEETICRRVTLADQLRTITFDVILGAGSN